jgi:hypothetical protein
LKDDTSISEYYINNNDSIEIFSKLIGGSGKNNPRNDNMKLCNILGIDISKRSFDVLLDDKGWLESDLVMLGINILCNDT